MHFISRLIIGLFCLLSLNTLWADANSDLITDLRPYERAHSDFKQTLYDDTGAVLLQSVGSLAIARPSHANEQGKLYWMTQSSSQPKQILVATGAKIYFFDASLNQVTIKDQKRSADPHAPGMLLTSSLPDIAVNYFINEKNTPTKKIYQLTPKKSDSMFGTLTLIFQKNAGNTTLSEMEIIDKLGQKNHIDFAGFKTGAPEALFTFIKPANAEVVSD